ncbi:restriction endonuclease [Paenibacillus sp. UKAQ_18]|nr:restriction endonuclease [Paenibacillus sp. UKAQ_18]
MLDFKEIGVDGNDFELLIRELLFSMGMKTYWSGKGPDGGKDLLCIETLKSKLLTTEKHWLVQCKHFAHSDRSVGGGEIDNIIDLCGQHSATGYMLVCSTYPSSSLVKKLKEINENPKYDLSTLCLDGAAIERMLSTPTTWNIAQRFFPNSANNGWKVYATENPNRWIVNYKGFYIHLFNRISSYIEP